MDGKKTFFESLEPKSALLVGIVAGVLILGTIGCIILAVAYFGGGDSSDKKVAITPVSAAVGEKAVPHAKSDKPAVELYAFSYCPYGLEAEKTFMPVVNLFGNKIDFKIRQIGAMHGDFEAVEAKRQLCVEKNYPAKYLSYVQKFAVDTSCETGEDACVGPKVKKLFGELGINEATVNSCMTKEGDALYAAEEQNAGEKGYLSSPTIVINGTATSQGVCEKDGDCNVGETCVEARNGKQCILPRTPESIKTAICAAFNNPPAECKTVLSTQGSAAGFGTDNSGGGAASCN